VSIPQGSYGLSVPGWTRHAVSTPELFGDHSYGTVATGNLDGTSYFVLLYVSVISVPPSPRAIAGIGNQGDHHYVTVTASGTLGASYGPPGVDPSPSAGTVALGTTVHPVVMEIDAMHMTFTAYTDTEKLSHAWVPTMGLGDLFVAGNASIGAGAIEYLYGALWKGPNAQLADADVRKLLESLGWTVTGY
jgi:hypothetical protein